MRGAAGIGLHFGLAYSPSLLFWWRIAVDKESGDVDQGRR